MHVPNPLRITADFHKTVRVECALAGGAVVRARLETVGTTGAVLTLEEAGTARIGDLVTLKIDGTRLAEPFSQLARVEDVRGTASRKVLDVAYVVEPRDRADLELRLRSVFNERRAFRVTPRISDRVTVEVVLEDEPHRRAIAELMDISVLGVGVRVASAYARELECGTPVRLTFRLPGQDAPFAIMAEVRNVLLRSGAGRVGLAFAFRGLDFQSRRAIARYVLARQVEIRRVSGAA